VKIKSLEEFHTHLNSDGVVIYGIHAICQGANGILYAVDIFNPGSEWEIFRVSEFLKEMQEEEFFGTTYGVMNESKYNRR